MKGPWVLGTASISLTAALVAWLIWSMPRPPKPAQVVDDPPAEARPSAEFDIAVRLNGQPAGGMRLFARANDGAIYRRLGRTDANGRLSGQFEAVAGAQLHIYDELGMARLGSVPLQLLSDASEPQQVALSAGRLYVQLDQAYERVTATIWPNDVGTGSPWFIEERHPPTGRLDLGVVKAGNYSVYVTRDDDHSDVEVLVEAGSDCEVQLGTGRPAIK